MVGCLLPRGCVSLEAWGVLSFVWAVWLSVCVAVGVP